MTLAAWIPLADHGDIVAALPFVGPALLLGGGLVFLIVRDRLGGDENSDKPKDGR